MKGWSNDVDDNKAGYDGPRSTARMRMATMRSVYSDPNSQVKNRNSFILGLSVNASPKDTTGNVKMRGLA